jgi:ribosomal-protein-alanine N-acetyltransferase
MTLTLRYMRLADIPQVVAIDQVSFKPAWSERSYAYEVGESSYSHMVVLENGIPASNSSLWRRIFTTPRETSRHIVAYGGLWHIVDEAHISTIATHPDFRGRGWGEIVLAGMVQKSVTLGAAYVVLEVRVSNTAAQSLYKKYGFEVVDVKKGYYHNNGEDAYDMRLTLQDDATLSRLAARIAALQTRAAYTDLFTQTQRTR